MTRKQLILERLEQERELRRQHIREGTIDQFQLEDISDANQYSHNYDHYNIEHQEEQFSEMRDPSQILLLEPSEDDEIERYHQREAQYTYQEQSLPQPQEIPQSLDYNEPQEENLDYNGFGFNPENLYDPNTMQNIEYSEQNKENVRNNDRKRSHQVINFK